MYQIFDRQQVPEAISALLDYWRDIERWLKIAENINGEAVIPAINELRYAGRQVLSAHLLLLQKEALSESDIS